MRYLWGVVFGVILASCGEVSNKHQLPFFGHNIFEEDDTVFYTVLDQDDRQTAMACEKLIRSYDPCISCSTHFLKLTVDRLEAGSQLAE